MRCLLTQVVLLGIAAATAQTAAAPSHAQTSAPAPAATDARLKVAVSLLPHAYFIERIGGALVDVTVMVGPGQSPHAFEPTPRQITALADARLYFEAGIAFEEALVPRWRSMFPRLEVVDLQAGIKLRPTEGAHVCSDPGHAHGEADGDPHTWLSPRLAKTQATAIADALCRADPAHAATYRENLAKFSADLDQVQQEIAEALAPFAGQEVFVYHPAFGYFLDEFGLKQVPVEIDGKQPSARQLVQVIEKARAANVHVIFVQPQFDDRSARALAGEIKGAVIPLDDLPRDYLANLRDMATKIRSSLKK